MLLSFVIFFLPWSLHYIISGARIKIVVVVVKSCCCIHLTFSRTCTTCFPNTFVLLWLKQYYTTCFAPCNFSNRFNLRVIFVKLILKKYITWRQICLLLLNIHNFFHIFIQLPIDWKFGLSIDRTPHHSLRALSSHVAKNGGQWKAAKWPAGVRRDCSGVKGIGFPWFVWIKRWNQYNITSCAINP